MSGTLLDLVCINTGVASATTSEHTVSADAFLYANVALLNELDDISETHRNKV
ncbi:hypothetical protein CY34DRAFT_740873 [Suillus luteus UH-Slu-Lm8-n1]|uniref:Uncharacterized protein n=1 Tax=Suillus luteus UH-Slu-Lm8-n1 TaxID=930992 RepID=A0A0D0AM57_9AGAM|nr:hypothetical protein CY34DRAFT_740873 [Suillus luteus UH-Slu-Lm8-n1]